MADRDEILAFANELLDVDAYPDYGPMGLQVAGAQTVERMACGVSASLELFERATALGAQMRAGVTALGLPLFADPDYASNTVTAIAMPDGVSAKALIAQLKERHGIDVASGQGTTADQMIRVGHMGWCDADDIDAVLDALAEAVPMVSHAGA